MIALEVDFRIFFYSKKEFPEFSKRIRAMYRRAEAYQYSIYKGDRCCIIFSVWWAILSAVAPFRLVSPLHHRFLHSLGHDIFGLGQAILVE